MKKILILSTNYGQGHMATAKAIEQGLAAQSKAPLSVEIVDFTESISRLLNKTSQRMYEDTTKYAPLLYKLFFESTDYPLPVKAFNGLNYRLSREKILQLFADKNPDLIICNSPHWQYITSLAREDGLGDIPVVSVITDSITLHTAWALGDSDGYVVPNSETAGSLHALGVPTAKIHELGYPIRLDFIQPNFSASKFLTSKGLSPHLKTILLLATGMRPLSLKRTIRNLQQNLPDSQLIIITGRDETLYPKLKSSLTSKTTVIEWTDKMPDYIRSSDLVITKAGGSTVMECIGAQKPVILSKIIPGQEEGNALYITKHHLGIVALEPDMVGHAAQKILSQYASYQKSLQKNSHPDAALKIADYLLAIL